MGDDLPDTQNTQTQTQNSQVDWSQNTPPFIPLIWGRLYSTKRSTNGRCWKITDNEYPDCYDLVQPDFSLGRAITCTFVVKKEKVENRLVKGISKLHFIIKRDISEQLSPAIITDLSHNGTFINGIKIGKGNSRVLDHNDEISVTLPNLKIFVFKDCLKNDQEHVPKQVSEKYYISRTLGQGACGLVKLVYDKVKCTKYAIKIMKALKHPCIISTEEVIDCDDSVYIVLELMQGGELFERITKQGKLSEKLTRFLFRQMVLAVKYLHSQGITHRDLKPENVLLESKDDECLIKITDFGLSKYVGEDSFMKTMCGTPLYLAPEVLRSGSNRPYGPEVDVWSLGVILFICLVGYLPFSSEYKELSLIDQILSGRYQYSASHWNGVSLQAKLLMKRMLTVQVEKRITLDQILNHSWMQDEDVIYRVEKLLSHTAMMKNFSQLTARSDEENNIPDNVTVVPLATKAKRSLSSSFSVSAPVPKKLRVAIYPENVDKSDDTSSLNNVNNCIMSQE